ncbi:MAG: hypothetical protein MZV65_33460 [Chromatiales bacterium]|nr:hypothetical protein [Chromatiales bacterium]
MRPFGEQRRFGEPAAKLAADRDTVRVAGEGISDNGAIPVSMITVAALFIVLFLYRPDNSDCLIRVSV